MSKTARGMFIGQRRDRLGARLLMTLTCVRLAEDFDTIYRINWSPKGADAPELEAPEELFDKAWMEVHFLTQKDFDAQESTALPIWHFKNDASPDRINAHLAAGRAVIVEEGFEVFAFPWEDAEQIRHRYRSFIDRITFTPMIRDEMHKIKTALAQNGSCAYHIRRGDILNGIPWKHSAWSAKIEPEEYYHQHMKKLEGAPAILFSDQPETLAAFKAAYPSLTTIQDITDLSQMTRAQRDFLELYAISCADGVVAPIISAFSMAAARISGRQRQTFREVLDNDELEEANQALVARLHQGRAQFISLSEEAHLYSKAHQYLTAQNRFDEAYELSKGLTEAGADNAFLPILHALNCLYVGKLREGQMTAKAGLQSPDIWPEDFAVLSATLGAILGGRRKRWGAGLALSRAFWAKPLRPDVIVLATRILYRNQLPYRLFPPMDWDLLKLLKQRWFPPFNNLYLVQSRLLKRRPCNFDMVLLDWHELTLDQKARRLFQDPERLRALQAALAAQTGFDADHPARASMAAMLDVHLGGPTAPAIDTLRRTIAQTPDAALYRKRLADLLERSGDQTGARMEWSDALALAPNDPFLLFGMANFLDRQGDQKKAEHLMLEAAAQDVSCAAIQGAAGQILLQRGAHDKAAAFLGKAHELYPTYKRFKNQLNRTQQRIT